MRNQVPERKSVGVGAGQIQRRYTCSAFVADRSVGHGAARYSASVERPPYLDGRTAMERRPYHEWRKRRCACGEAVRFPDERSEVLCEAKSQEAARRESALVCGSNKRIWKG